MPIRIHHKYAAASTIDPVKIRAALMKLHGCVGCGGRDEHKSYTCPVLSAEMADTKRAQSR